MIYYRDMLDTSTLFVTQGCVIFLRQKGMTGTLDSQQLSTVLSITRNAFVCENQHFQK